MPRSTTLFLSLAGLLLAGGFPRAHAQGLTWGISAGAVRSFVYSRGFSTKGPSDYVRAEGHWGYQLGAHIERPLGPKTAVEAAGRWVSTTTTYEVTALVPSSFPLTHTWRAARRNYRLSAGVAQVLAARGSKALRVYGGLVAGVETQQLRFERPNVSLPASSLAIAFDYREPPARAWGVGAEAGVGLRVHREADLNLRYNYNFTRTAPIAYTSAITHAGPPGSTQSSTGVIQGRPVFATAEVVFWFK